MYEEKSKKLNLNWKSLLIKLLIVFAVLFIGLWLVSLLKNDNKGSKKSNLSENLGMMQTVALDYFKGSKLPETVNGKKKISLQEMLDSKLMIEFKDQDGNSCDAKNSFAEATKINDEDYTIKVKLVCGEKQDYVIDTIKVKDDSTIASDDDNNLNNPITNTVIGTITPNKNTQNNNSTNTTNNSVNNKKPTVNTTKPSVSKPNDKEPTKPDSCTYGDKTYSAIYPLAYVIPGECAASMSDYYKSEYANKASAIGVQEYQKLNNEIVDLRKKTNANLYVDAPKYFGIYNNSNKGFVGYQIMFVVKQKLNYSAKVIYEYYLDQNGKRKVIIDNRSSLDKSNNNTNVGDENTKPTKPESIVTAVILNQNVLELEVGKSSKIGAVIKGTNVSGKVISWSSNDSSIASVDQNGIITGKKVGVTTILATCDGKVDSLVVTVKEAKYLNLNVQSISITVGDIYNTLYNTNLNNLTWSSSNPNVASVDQNGKVIAKNKGVTTISAVAGEFKVSYTVTVKSINGVKESIKFYDSSVQLMPGFTKTIYYDISNPYNKNIIWSSSNTSIATVKDGVITGVNPGTAIISARVGSGYTSMIVYVY